MNVVNITSNFIPNCAKHIVELNSGKAIVIVPEKSCISPLKTAIAFEMQAGIPPTIISLEGLSDSTNDSDKSKVLSRNVIFAKVFELTQQHITNELDASTFTRAIIGELPNLHASGITPRKIINDIPATVASQKEINLNLFTHIWQELNTWIATAEAVPYYLSQSNTLKNIVQKCQNEQTEIFLIHDFNRSPILHNCINDLKNSQIKSTVFVQNYEELSETFSVFSRVPITNSPFNYEINPQHLWVKSNASEEFTIANLTLQELQMNQQSYIGIVCEDETLSKKISLELTNNKVSHQHNIATDIQSNSLIKLFIAILEQKPEKILPILKLSSGEKKEILSEIINKNDHAINAGGSTNSTWRNFLQLFPKKSKITKTSITETFANIERNKNKVHTRKGEFPTFLQFKHFILKEINAFEGVTVEKSIIMHIAASWKIWENVTPSNIKICNLRTVLFQKFDAIILTSAFKTQPTGNAIFSCGMRLYYGFDTPDISHNILQTISTKTISTAPTPPFINATERHFFKPRQVIARINNNAQLAILKTQMPRILSATQIELLFENPLAFYYQYIKNLKTVDYASRSSLEIGNILHEIIASATDKIKPNNQYNFTEFVKKEFTKYGDKFKSVEVFHIRAILKILEEISQKTLTHEITAETKGISTTVNLNGEIFTITAKADRIDKSSEEIIIYDYKSGSSTAFTKSNINNIKKIQLLIPAMFFAQFESSQKMFGNYTFLEHSIAKNLFFEISPTLIDKFQKKLLETLELYVENGEILPSTGNMRNFYHASRVL